MKLNNKRSLISSIKGKSQSLKTKYTEFKNTLKNKLKTWRNKKIMNKT
jgi:hypothetical protein